MPEGKKKVDKTATLDADRGSSPLGQSISEADASVIKELKTLYKEKLLPIERKCQFQKFGMPEILDSELGAKPNVLLIGQYSVGKTTFIRHLIGQDYPDIHIGPEPTTDGFIAVVHGENEKTIKGNALTGVGDLPFSGLSTFGSSFLNKFNAAVVPAPVLKQINIVDTPGVLSGEKQRNARGYDFSQVARWFAERSDLILLLFDCSKLDISDEFRAVIQELQPHEDKVHCVLNKADQLDQESLMRVYGALLWSMGRIFKGAEVARIYVGSFRDGPLERKEHEPLFDKDKKSLMSHLDQLPNACSMRKINEMVKRLRKCVVHACLMGHLRSKMPYLWGKEAVQAKLIENLEEIFAEVRRKYQLAAGDFPKLEEYKANLQLSDFTTFPAIDRQVLTTLQDMLLKDVPKITALVAGVGDAAAAATAAGGGKKKKSKKGGDGSSEVDDGGDDDRQPQMFQILDGDSGNILGMVVIALAVLLVVMGVAVFIISHNESHKTAIEIWNLLNAKVHAVGASTGTTATTATPAAATAIAASTGGANVAQDAIVAGLGQAAAPGVAVATAAALQQQQAEAQRQEQFRKQQERAKAEAEATAAKAKAEKARQEEIRKQQEQAKAEAEAAAVAAAAKAKAEKARQEEIRKQQEQAKAEAEAAAVAAAAKAKAEKARQEEEQKKVAAQEELKRQQHLARAQELEAEGQRQMHLKNQKEAAGKAGEL